MAKWRALLKASSVHHEITVKTDKNPELWSSAAVLSVFGSDSVVTKKRDSEAESASHYAPDSSCPGCELRLWWQRADGVWVCVICPDPVKCRYCDRPHYSHDAWPMVCDRWEPQA